MKQFTDKKRSERVFSVGDRVWLKLQPYRQKTVGSNRENHKLAAKYYGPFHITMVIGKVAYKLKLPDEAGIHDVFHVSLLKKFRGVLPNSLSIPLWFRNKEANERREPIAIIDRRMVKSQNGAKTQFLVHWKDCDIADASWEFARDFVIQYPDFDIDLRTNLV